MERIHTQLEQGIPLESRSIIFSPVNLKPSSKVKLTRWEWVSEETPNVGIAESQIADDSFLGRSVLPLFAKKHPKLLSRIFKNVALSDFFEGVTVAPPAALMGAEAKVVGQLTEMGLFFLYDEKLEAVLNKIYQLFNEQRNQNKFPVNTAIYIRFPNKPNSNDHMVVIDFASMGLNLRALKDFVAELVIYLESEGVKTNLHYGKTNGINTNNTQYQPDERWGELKKKYHTFYSDYQMDEPLLKQKMNAFEKKDPLENKSQVLKN